MLNSFIYALGWLSFAAMCSVAAFLPVDFGRYMVNKIDRRNARVKEGEAILKQVLETIS